jgi:hypothetical protein
VLGNGDETADGVQRRQRKERIRWRLRWRLQWGIWHERHASKRCEKVV